MVQPAGRPMVAAAGGQGEAAPEQQRQGFGQTVAGIIRMAVLWYFAMKFFGPKRAPTDPSQLMSNLFLKGDPLLKSVAHLPWRQMTYKFLNTIIADLFAFVIKMPVLHRLSVFRDDLIFLIYLYQGWLYPVDKKRVNEFGFGGEDENQENKSSISSDTTTEDTRTVGDKETN